MSTSRSRLSVIAALCCGPAFVLVTAGLLQTGLGHEVVTLPDWLIHPALVLGGLAAATALAIGDAIRLHIDSDADALALQVVIQRRPLALRVLAAVAALGAVIGLYLIAENLLA